MNNIFIRPYLDEDVNVLVAALLKARGFDALTARDADKLQLSDEDQLAYAVSQKRTLITHNRGDFEDLVQQYFSAQKTHYGVILAVRRPPQVIARLLIAILNQLTADEMQNQVLYM